MTLPHCPSICFGEVIHKRSNPKKNAFRYSVFYLRIPMRSRSANPKVLSKFGVGDNRFSWLSFYDQDHGIGDNDALNWIETEIKKSNITGVDGEIWLHTFPRVLGYVFNPVSFWFCHNAAGEIKVIFAEVNNTFGGRHYYLLESKQQDHIRFGEALEAKKDFHVSPFYYLAGRYQFRFMRRETAAGSAQNVSRIEYWIDDQLQLTTSISGQELPLTRQNAWLAIVKYPLQTFGITLKIHWQAIRLWAKGVVFYGKNPSQNLSN